jgi:hypothetical protein
MEQITCIRKTEPYDSPQKSRPKGSGNFTVKIGQLSQRRLVDAVFVVLVSPKGGGEVGASSNECKN